MLQSVQEFTDITALIKGILNGYPGNSAIFREYLQNSDDARATSQLFILDERSYPTNFIVDPALKDTQGPALIAVNNGLLRDVDWTALRKINSSSKGYDETQTGKNGLGFRASYHLTENPHILSGQRLMILDPHHAFTEGYKGGISIAPSAEFPIEVLEERFQDQFAPFRFLFGDPAAPFRSFDGTAFRLPLRTEDQARRSQIKDTATSVQDMREALLSFVRNDVEQSILFLKHITSIRIRHIDAFGVERASIAVSTDELPSPLPSSYTRNITITMDGTSQSRSWLITHHVESRGTAERVLSDRLKYDVGDSLMKDKLVASVELAIPKDASPIRGRLFTLLPLPQLTNFPVHLNAVFALTTDRQGLKNMHEVGQLNSRERRLVEWNRTIFDTWVPEAWANMLTDVPAEILSSASWALWPPEEHGEDCYWAGLCHSLVNLVISRGMKVFPTRPYEMQTDLVALPDTNILIASAHPAVNLETLSEVGIQIIQPPPHIYAILAANDTLASSLLTPESLHRQLCKIARSGVNCEREKLHAVMDYLVFSSSPPALQYVAGLQWLYCANDYPAPLNLPGVGPRYLIPSSEQEAKLFRHLPHMLAWDSFSERLRQHLSVPSAARAINIGILDTAGVFSYLSEKYMFSGPDSDEKPGFQVDWVVEFWSWVIGWSRQSEFFEKIGTISNVFLLPTAAGNLRKLASGAISFADADAYVVDVWNTVGVSPLHHGIPADVVSQLRRAHYVFFPRSPRYIVHLIRCCNVSPQGVSDERVKEIFDTIRSSLYDDLPRNAIVDLLNEDKAKLSSFPIFHVRTEEGSASALKSVSAERIYVHVDDSFPLPVLQRLVTYVDVRDDVTLRMANLLDSQGIKINKPSDLLRLAADYWHLQPSRSQDLFAHYALNNWRRLSPKLRSDFECLPFVSVNEQLARRPPKDLVHPDSTLEKLYAGEAGRMPVGRFAEKDYMIIMQTLGFLHAELDEFIIEDRLSYFSTTNPSKDRQLINKAKAFIRLLDLHWKDQYAPRIASYRDQKWLPSPTKPHLISPAECRDGHYDLHSNPHYFDLVWDVLPNDILSPKLRSALGWSQVVPSSVLVDQYQRTLDLSDGLPRTTRLLALLSYLDQLWRSSNLDSEAVQMLRSASSNRSWVPIADSPNETVQAEYALFYDCGLRAPFHHIHSGLKDNVIILEMGCTKRPAFDVLKNELASQLSSPSGLGAAVAILNEIAEHHHGTNNQEAILIPGEDCRPHSFDSVYYRDMKFAPFSTAISSMAATHAMISKNLAEVLGIRMLSSIALGDMDEDEEQMSEDLVSRIGGFLRDYDPQYAFNEFLANADDAGANEFHMYLAAHDHMADAQEKVISSEFQSLLRSPSFFIYNNARMSEEDFAGLRRVGQGGKLEQSDTHGRHGLGALSLYYFTDVVTVISGEYVMILDPSGRYLPPLTNGGKRTALRRRINDIISVYPDHLKACEPLGVSATTLMFHGTLFFLPLQSTISKKACDYTLTRDFVQGNYHDLAQKAFYFTRMERISATEIMAGRPRRLWELSAKRSSVRALSENFSLFTLRVKPNGSLKQEEAWFITTSEAVDIPAEHEVTATELKLHPQSKMKVQLAINPELFGGDVEKPIATFPFSTMALPRSISLPFHLNARFAISSNRQGLVLNSADSQNRHDRKTSFNRWVLESIVPPLYLASLEYLIPKDGSAKDSSFTDHRWWLLKCSDEMSKITRDGFFSAIVQAENRIFQSADQQWIPFRESVFSKDEPREVRKILNVIKAPNYVPISRRASVFAIPHAKTVNPDFVRDALLQHRASLETLREKLQSSDMQEDDIFKTLNYTQSATPLVGLPLLLLSDGQLVEVPKRDQTEIYMSSDRSHFTLFPSSAFVQTGQKPEGGYSLETLKCLDKDDSINVATLTDKNIPTLIMRELNRLEDREKVEWVEKFWMSYFSLPGPPSLGLLEKSQLPLVLLSSGLVPLSDCHPDRVVYESESLLLLPWLGPVLRQMGIPVVGANSILRGFLSERFPDDLDNVVQCIAAKGVSCFLNLGAEELSQLADWIQTQMSGRFARRSGIWSERCPVSRDFLLKLPIWEVFTDGATRLDSASNLEILPSRIRLERIKPFLKDGVSIASGSPTLMEFIKFCRQIEAHEPPPSMTCPRVWNSIIIPTRITQTTKMLQWKAFIGDMLSFSSQDLQTITMMIPNRNGYLRPVNEFYDESVELFARSFMFLENPPFVHGEFRPLVSSLWGLGLVHLITVDTFRNSAKAIRDAIPMAVSNPTSLQSLREMSTTAFTIYQGQLPSQIMTNRSAWQSLDDIAFVLPKAERRQRATYDVNEFLSEPLPPLLSPSRFVRADLAAIAWTQRALFLSEPSEAVLAVNKSLGVPQVQEVVQHLKVLTTRIALAHQRNRTLLSDIKATYKWLNEHHEEAREYLLALENERLFLNVADPENEAWIDQWVAAKDLVINLEFDTGSKRYIRNFLKSYEDLLLAAGCSSLTLGAEYGAEQAPRRDTNAELEKYRLIWGAFKEMREKGELTDVILVPQDGDDNQEDDPMRGFIEESHLRAHGHLLAASIPHLRMSLDKYWSPDGKIKFFGTAVGAKSLLDFVYTGEMEISQRTDDPDKLAILQRDLLELLSTANEWQMEDLKDKLQWEIVHKHKMIQRLPHTFDIMLQEARLHNARRLEEALERFRQRNVDFLQELSRS